MSPAGTIHTRLVIAIAGRVVSVIIAIIARIVIIIIIVTGRATVSIPAMIIVSRAAVLIIVQVDTYAATSAPVVTPSMLIVIGASRAYGVYAKYQRAYDCQSGPVQ